MRLRRSELSTPGSSEKMMEKAASSGADFVFLPLASAGDVLLACGIVVELAAVMQQHARKSIPAKAGT